MIEIARILCPLDFSDCSRRAVHHTMALARWFGSSVTAFHVYPWLPAAAISTGPLMFQPTMIAADMRDQSMDAVRQTLAAEGDSGVATTAVVSEGSPAAGILKQADRMDADLIVMGTHGRTGVDRLIIGSVAERVLRKATCPVMTVPPAAPDEAPAWPVLYKSIVCPVDFSDSSMRALEYAFSLARETDAHLVVVHVTPQEIDVPFEESAGDTGLTVADFFQRREDDARQRLKRILRSEQGYCTAEQVVTHGGRAWQEILRVAGVRRADLIVMGVHGRGAVDLLLLGSTTQQVIRQSTCPVLTVRSA